MKENKRSTSSMPSKKVIRDYWENKSPEMFYKNLDWYLSHDNVYDHWVFSLGKDAKDLFCCFACGFEKTIERCHIIAHCEGGSDDVENLHLLCNKCHIITEGMVIKDVPLTKFMYDEFVMNKKHYRIEKEEIQKDAIIKYIKNNPHEDMLKTIKLIIPD
jgi:5-methylcytosine-specific restriction endonuclease McrA